MSYRRTIGHVVGTTKTVVIRFVDLLVTAFAVASGLAWKDCVVSWFQTGGPLGFTNLGPFFFAMAITVVGALLTAWRAMLPPLPKNGDDKKSS